jgi:3-deoxy-D-manno-octulosonic-acid transferase
LTTSRWIYNAAAAAVLPAGVLVSAAQGRLKGGWRRRLGFAPHPPDPDPGRPRVWVHAVSVGEVQVASALSERLTAHIPGVDPVFSASTDTGLAELERRLPGARTTVFPFDAYGAPRRALQAVRPDMVVILETELWPGFIWTAREMGVRLMLANGRISARSVRGYRRVRFLLRDVLAAFDRLAMIGPAEADRIVSLGADPDRVEVVGNAKFDGLAGRRDTDLAGRLKEWLGLAGRPVWTAGSTRRGEEPVVLDVYRRLKRDHPDLVLILAPRHPNRVREVGRSIDSRGLAWTPFSAVPTRGLSGAPDVILVDVMGWLFHLYGLTDLAFCGGSLVPLGGQNPVEPAVWGVPVLFGPHMDDFAAPAEGLVAAGGGAVVDDAFELEKQLHGLLVDDGRAAEMGRAGQKEALRHQGAADRTARMAKVVLESGADGFRRKKS